MNISACPVAVNATHSCRAALRPGIDLAAYDGIGHFMLHYRKASVDKMDDDAIRALVTRLARPHSSGGKVIERAAVLAEGTDSTAVIMWIIAHAGKPEAMSATPPRLGLHGSRLSDGSEAESRTPPRYVLPASALA